MFLGVCRSRAGRFGGDWLRAELRNLRWRVKGLGFSQRGGSLLEGLVQSDYCGGFEQKPGILTTGATLRGFGFGTGGLKSRLADRPASLTHTQRHHLD